MVGGHHSMRKYQRVALSGRLKTNDLGQSHFLVFVGGAAWSYSDCRAVGSLLPGRKKVLLT